MLGGILARGDRGAGREGIVHALVRAVPRLRGDARAREHLPHHVDGAGEASRDVGVDLGVAVPREEHAPGGDRGHRVARRADRGAARDAHHTRARVQGRGDVCLEHALDDAQGRALADRSDVGGGAGGGAVVCGARKPHVLRAVGAGIVRADLARDDAPGDVAHGDEQPGTPREAP